MAASRADDPELELPVCNLLDHGLSYGDRKPHADVGMSLLELAEEHRDDRAAGPRRRSELERARELALLVAEDVLEQLLLEREQPLRARVQAKPSLGRLDAAPRAVEQLPPEPLLERPDLEADRRLRDTEPLRSLREALALDDRAEGCKLARIHKDPGDYLLDEPK